MPETASTTGRRERLPQLGAQVFLTDSGLETDLIFHHGFELPSFAAFPLLDDDLGRAALARYYSEHAAVAAAHGAGFVYETPTWRANVDWGARLGYGPGSLREVNQRAVGFVRALMPADPSGAVLSGCLGPRSDGYRPLDEMGVAESREYHRLQVDAFAEAGVDMVNAMTITYPAEAIGIVQAAVEAGLPVAISFTVETDGRLPDATTLEEAVRATDAATDAAAAYFMVNCAHPDHIEPAFAASGDRPGDWTHRIRGIRANASRRSHAELDEASELDDGDPAEFAAAYRRLRAQLPGLTVLGGCCGTDVRHVAAVAAACLTG